MTKKTINVVRYLLGMFFVALGVSIAIKSNLGTAPVSAIPYTITLISGTEMGMTTMLFQMSLVVFQLLLEGKEFPRKNFLQIVVSVVFGYMTTLSNKLFAMLPVVNSIILRIPMCILSAFVIAVGLTLYVPANIMCMPAEGFVQVVARKTGVAFSWVKMIFDCSVVTISGVLCLLAFHGLASVGIGTVMSALLVGFFHRKINTLLTTNVF